MERSYVMLKPGVLNRRIAGEIISRLEKKGLKLVGMKLLKITAQLADRHYAEHKDKDFYADLKSYISAQERISQLSRDQKAWARMSLRNIARSGKFSSDRTIAEYAEQIWHIESILPEENP